MPDLPVEIEILISATGDYLDEEPFCVYQPRSEALKARKTAAVAND